MYALAVTIGLLCQYVGLYLVWRNRWNIPTHFQLGFAVTAFIVPALLTDVLNQAANRTVTEMYLYIQMVGGLGYVLGVLSSRFFSRPIGLFDKEIGRFLYATPASQLERRVFVMAAAAATGLIASYFIMGFIPMFADNPLAAKQFKGEYQAPYHRAAWLFRFSFAVASAIMPVLLAAWWRNRRAHYLALGVLIVLLLISTLARASALAGLVIFVGIVCAYHRRFTVLYFLGVVAIFGVGSAAYFILGLLLDIPLLTARYEGLTLPEVMGAGAPDIVDHLSLLENFLGQPTYTYGRTFLGGLIPYNYPWNPSVWSLLVINPGTDDISDTVSGGLRLPVSIWGYVSFGWAGCFFVPLLSGLLLGIAARAVRHRIQDLSIVHAAVLLVVFNTLFLQVSNFYFLSIHNIPPIAVALILCFGMPRLTVRSIRGSDDRPVIPLATGRHPEQ